MKDLASKATLVATLITAACGGAAGAPAGSGVAATPAPAPASPPPAATTTAAGTATETALPPGVTAEMVKAGGSLFNAGSCAKCHGMNGRNGTYGPNLTDKSWSQISGTYPEIVGVITRGVPDEDQKLPSSKPQFAMRERGGMGYNDEQIRALAAYVYSISHAK